MTPRSAWNWLAKVTRALACAIRSGLALPCPVPSSTPEPFDLKWFTITANPSESGEPTFLKAWASGSRAFANGALPTRILDVPMSETLAGW